MLFRSLGLVVMVLEVFVPSGGILGVLSLLAIVAAVATAFFELGVTAGMIVTGVVVVVVFVFVATGREQRQCEECCEQFHGDSVVWPANASSSARARFSSSNLSQ